MKVVETSLFIVQDIGIALCDYRKVSMEKLSLNMGTSLPYIQSTYSHMQTRRNADELTKGMGKWNK